jgi:hypothetical protein
MVAAAPDCVSIRSEKQKPTTRIKLDFLANFTILTVPGATLQIAEKNFRGSCHPIVVWRQYALTTL